MTKGERIRNARRAAGMTQEELAERLNVSRQSVSKWESDVALPETEKLLELCQLFSLSADELLFGESRAGESKEVREETQQEDGNGVTWGRIKHAGWHYEYISKARFLGLPVLHINVGLGVYRAKGVFALGNIATGFFSLGLLSLGILCYGILSLGLFAFGSIALGGVAAGGVAAGLLAFGGVAVGVLSFGGFSVGYVAFGGASVGTYAVGDWAHGFLAVGVSHATGEHTFLLPQTMEALDAFLSENVSPSIGGIIKTFAEILA